MTETTREQDQLIEDQASTWGAAQVLPLDNTTAVIVIGMTDDVERTHLYVPETGQEGTRAAKQSELAVARNRALGCR